MKEELFPKKCNDYLLPNLAKAMVLSVGLSLIFLWYRAGVQRQNMLPEQLK